MITVWLIQHPIGEGSVEAFHFKVTYFEDRLNENITVPTNLTYEDMATIVTVELNESRDYELRYGIIIEKNMIKQYNSWVLHNMTTAQMFFPGERKGILGLFLLEKKMCGPHHHLIGNLIIASNED